MKVTKKLGWRKYSRHSSISRRRFSNNKNKKRYGKTHKGGCWTKSKKGGARSRKHGHKRGKRVHNGGVNFFTGLLSKNMTQILKEQEQSDKKATIITGDDLKSELVEQLEYPLAQFPTLLDSPNSMKLVVKTGNKRSDNPDNPDNYSIPIIKLKCQKKYWLSQNKKFWCFIRYSRSFEDNSIQVHVTLVKKNDKNIKFVFKGTPDHVATIFRDLRNLQEVLATIVSQSFNEETGLFEKSGEPYSFNFPENQDLFNAIADVIEQHKGSAEKLEKRKLETGEKQDATDSTFNQEETTLPEKTPFGETPFGETPFGETPYGDTTPLLHTDERDS